MGVIAVVCEPQTFGGEISEREFDSEFAEVWRQQFRHDLRQPLMTASLLVDVVASVPQLDEDSRRRLAEIQGQLEWMQDLLRLQGGGPGVRVVDVGETIAGHCTPGATGCAVHLHRDDPAYTRVDPVELIRAARNLLDNASRAAGQTGVVEVTVGAARAHALLQVADDGPGFGRIQPQHGYGLASVKLFAERYGGALEIGGSRLGGTAVTISLPLVASYRAA
jgi:signal transduction histidine kinase